MTSIAQNTVIDAIGSPRAGGAVAATENLSPSILAPSEGVPLGVPDAMAWGDSGTVRDALAAGAGREAPLDLIEEHLTDSLFHAGFRVGEHSGRLLQGWNFPSDWSGPPPDGDSFVLKIQPFAQGGYEATVRAVNLPRIGQAMEGLRPVGKREAPEELSVESIMKASARAKRRVRHLCRNMMATHLLTLTRRESDDSEFWTPEQWAEAWDRLRRLLTRVLGPFPYVAILEQHKKGNYHLHVAWVGKINVQLVRKMWLSIVGAGAGNIDAKQIRVPPGHDRSGRIARYISKYVSKSFEDNPRFNKKRYWASKQSLEEARRYVLRALTLDGAMEEIKRLLGLDYGKFLVLGEGGAKTRNLFMFPNGSGAWLSYLPGVHDPDPPF